MKTKFIADDTLAILEKGQYQNKAGATIDLKPLMAAALDGTRLYKPAELDDILAATPSSTTFETEYACVNDTTLNAVRNCVAEGAANVLCLNFASARNLGGGFLSGAIAQEECIARASGLYPCQLKAESYYSYHRKLKTCLYSHYMIYSPAVPVIKNEAGNLLDAPVLCAIITSPAVNAGAVVQNEPENANQITPLMKERTERVLALALHHGHDTLVLGAWGCGVFRNDPAGVARLFGDS